MTRLPLLPFFKRHYDRHTPVLLTIIAAIVVSGCNTTPQEPQLAPMIDTPPIPETRSAEVTLTMTPSIPGEVDSVRSDSHSLVPNSRIVINVPDEYRLFRANAFASTRAGGPHHFATLGYFHAAEHAIERQLIRQGFRPVSREKFEAKLREIRDKSALRPFEVWAVFDDDYNEALRNLGNSLEAGEIDQQEFASQALELRREFGIDEIGGQNRDDGSFELSDMSELIRAAQSGAENERADYILEIGRFTIDPSAPLQSTVNLLAHPDMRNFLNENPWTRETLREAWVNMPYEQLAARLEARLVDVRTGEIVWLGSCLIPEGELGEEGDPLTVRYEIHEEVTNEATVARFVDEQNTRQARILRERQGDPALPEYEMATNVRGPDVISGVQRIDRRTADERERITRELARRAAEELIQTIRFEGN